MVDVILTRNEERQTSKCSEEGNILMLMAMLVFLLPFVLRVSVENKTGENNAVW